MSEDKHYLKVKNFGPLKDVEIDLTNKDLIVLIGPQASGKSTIAKLLGMLMDTHLINSYYRKGNQPTFLGDYFVSKSLDYGLQQYWDKSTTIDFKSELIENLELATEKFDLKYFQAGNVITDIDLLVLRNTFEQINTVLLNHQHKNESTLRNVINRFLSEIEMLSNRQIEIKENQFVEPIGKIQFRKDLMSQIKAKVLKEGFSADKTFRDLIVDLYNSFSDFVAGKEVNLVYVSSERNLLSLIGSSSFSFIKMARETSLPGHLLELGELYQKERNSHSVFKSPTLGLKIVSHENMDYLEIDSDNKILLRNSASGVQSIIPLEVVVSANSKTSYDSNIFIIEEPELNLYPTTQKKLVEFLVEKCTQNGNKLIITTHSPYILTALNNHITAHNVAKERPELAEEMALKVPREQWLDFDTVGAYYVDKGTAKKPIMDNEHKLINYEQIDDVADELGETFDDLIRLQYKKAQ